MQLKVKLTTLLALAASAFFVQANAGVGEGQVLYDSYCLICHGDIGQGQTMGKPLNDNNAKRLSDGELIDVINNGRAGTGMAAWGSSMSEQEILDIAGYVRVLQGSAGLSTVDENADTSSDPAVAAGESVFTETASCVTCHSFKDSGGSVGPALDGVSSRLDDEALQQALLNPSKTIVDGYKVKVVETADGKIVKGRFRNESERALQIQSEDGKRWVTYFKDRVKSVSDSDESLMPDVYAELGAEDQQNLMAFLKSL